MEALKTNVSEIISQIKIYLSPLQPYMEYICFFPQRYMGDELCECVDDQNDSEISVEKWIVSSLTITNVTTGVKINFGEVNFNLQTEEVSVNDIPDKPNQTLTNIVQAVSDKLNWSPSEQVIVVSIKTNGSPVYNFSYGVTYYCIKDISGNAIDMCIKDAQGNYVPITKENQETIEYDSKTIEIF